MQSSQLSHPTSTSASLLTTCSSITTASRSHKRQNRNTSLSNSPLACIPVQFPPLPPTYSPLLFPTQPIFNLTSPHGDTAKNPSLPPFKRYKATSTFSIGSLTRDEPYLPYLSLPSLTPSRRPRSQEIGEFPYQHLISFLPTFPSQKPTKSNP